MSLSIKTWNEDVDTEEVIVNLHILSNQTSFLPEPPIYSYHNTVSDQALLVPRRKIITSIMYMVQLCKTKGRILIIISVHKMGIVHINRHN
jgi:hypothetical protein